MTSTDDTVAADMTAMQTPTPAALDAVMSSMTGLASFMRGLLDDAASIIRIAKDERGDGLDVDAALNHAQMLLSQIDFMHPHFNDLAEGVSALYERRSRHWTYSYGKVPMSERIYPDIQERIDHLTAKVEEVRLMDKGTPNKASPEAFRRLVRYHDVGHVDVLGLAQSETAPPSLAAAAILHMHYGMMCTITSSRTFTRGRSGAQVVVDWANWTGWAFHNMAEMTTGKHDQWHPEFFVSECRWFVESARTKPVPAAWHPENPSSDDHPGPGWKRLCEFVARQARMEPAYGVPVESGYIQDEMPPYPEPPKPILGLHTAASVQTHWFEVQNWCRRWANAERNQMFVWTARPPKTPQQQDQQCEGD